VGFWGGGIREERKEGRTVGLDRCCEEWLVSLSLRRQISAGVAGEGGGPPPGGGQREECMKAGSAKVERRRQQLYRHRWP
jgi:hypothetical protein